MRRTSRSAASPTITRLSAVSKLPVAVDQEDQAGARRRGVDALVVRRRHRHVDRGEAGRGRVVPGERGVERELGGRVGATGRGQVLHLRDHPVLRAPTERRARDSRCPGRRRSRGRPGPRSGPAPRRWCPPRRPRAVAVNVFTGGPDDLVRLLGVRVRPAQRQVEDDHHVLGGRGGRDLVVLRRAALADPHGVAGGESAAGEDEQVGPGDRRPGPLAGAAHQGRGERRALAAVEEVRARPGGRVGEGAHDVDPLAAVGEEPLDGVREVAVLAVVVTAVAAGRRTSGCSHRRW